MGGVALEPPLAVMLRRADPLFSRILVGTDGSDHAACAIRQAARIAELVGAELEIAHVHERGVPSTRGWRADGVEESEDILAEARRIAATRQVKPTTTMLTGHPSAALAAEATRRFADLLVVGPDVSFLEKPRLVGGVAAHSLRDEACSVLVARPPGDERAFPTRILSAVDSSESAAEAARQGAILARINGAQLNVLTVRGGSPGPSVVRTAGEWRADLIVVGTHGRHGLSRLISGSVSAWVASHAPCSVLVARPRPR